MSQPEDLSELAEVDASLDKERVGAQGRATFRGQFDGVCYQRLVRDEMATSTEANLLFPRPSDAQLNLKAARVRPISRALAWKVISRYEWLGMLPPNCGAFYGIFFGDICGGVACYQMGWCGAGTMFPGWIGVERTRLAYLARGACVHWAPKGTAPKLINFSARMTNLEVAIAFSDTDAGEIGTVYQAAGWTCLGWGVKNQELVSPSGRVYNIRSVADVSHKNGITYSEAQRQLVARGWRIQPNNPKLRYAMLLDAGRSNERLLARFRESEIPYPKRAVSQVVGS